MHEPAVELCAPQQNVSERRAMLTDAAILTRRKDGIRVHDAIGDDEIFARCERWCGSLEHQLRGLAALVDDFAARPAALNPQPTERPQWT